MSYFDSDTEKDDKTKNYDTDEEEDEDIDVADDVDVDYDSENSNEDLFNLDENIQSIEATEKRVREEESDEEILNEEFDVSSDEEDENYLQKFNKEVNKNYIAENHPECIVHNNHEIETLSCITRDSHGIIIDINHSTLPILTKYEKTRVLGQRAKQINHGAKAYIDIPKGVIDGYVIAEMELKAKKIPFIIQRPMPNGSKEFWKLEDLEQIDF
jgi:DNA-directed RNA polymerase subunit K/omega